jgi:hypothetical protein
VVHNGDRSIFIGGEYAVHQVERSPGGRRCDIRHFELRVP